MKGRSAFPLTLNLRISFGVFKSVISRTVMSPSTRLHAAWAINWEEGRITWHLDGRPVHVYEGPTPEGKMYLLMAMFQIGGWVGRIDENLPYPLDFEIDYVRVWKKN